MVSATLFDGRTTRVQAVELSLAGTELIVTGNEFEQRIPFADVIVDERLGSAPRRLRLPGGACCEVSDLAALAGLLAAAAHRDGWVDQMQHRWGWILFALLAFGAVASMGYKWGLPWAAAYGARRLPPAVASTISAQAMNALDGGLLSKSRLPDVRQKSLTDQFDALQAGDTGASHGALLFRASPQLGANAFTLPDGRIVLLDDLTKSIGDDPHILAVLAHELGHAHEHHGMQLLLRSTAVGAFLTFYVGDISQLLAAAPAAVVQARYSREFETQADDFAAALLTKHGLSPGLLADDLSRLSRLRPEAPNAGYLASHPPTEERIRHLRELASERFTADHRVAGVAGETVEFPSGERKLHGLLYKPEGSGPFPALLYNHGSAPGLLNNEAFARIAPILVGHGWVFFAPYRRGQGLSADAGPYSGDVIEKAKARGGIPAAEKTMVQLLSTDHLQDQMNALEWLKKQPFIRADRIAAMGNSFGGIETVLGAAQGGYCAAIDVAGGAESWDVAPTLRAAMERAVRNSRVPTFFLQAYNDYDIAPSRTLYATMRAAGGKAQMKIYPAFGDTNADGHSFAYRGTDTWKSDVLKFLDENCP